MAEQGAADLKGRLLRGAASIGNSHDYSKVYDVDTYRALAKDKARRRAGKRIAKLDETNEVVEMLLAWATAKSRDANSVTDIKGVSLQDFLPKFRVIESIDDLPSSQHLLRVVVAVVFESTLEGKTTLRLPNMIEFLHAQRAGSEAAAAGSLSLSDELVADIKSEAKSQAELAAKTVRLATKYLHLPQFNPKDITGGNTEVVLALLGHLMLASAAPAQHPSQIQKVGELIRAFESAVGDLGSARRALGAGPGGGLAAVRGRWEELVGLREVEVERGAETAAAVAVEGSAATGGEAAGAAAAAGAEAGAEADPAAPPAPAPAPAPAPEDPDAKFTRLLQAVDTYLASLGDPAAPACPGGTLLGQVRGLQEAVEGVAAVRGEAGALEAAKEAGVRLGTEVRGAVAAMQYEMMLGEGGLKWASR